MTAWSPSQYLKFEDERTRPARDLLAAVPLEDARRAVDIGCGPGNSTGLLARRFPGADIAGIDSSPEMIAAARARLPGVTFAEAGISAWTPDAPVDLLFANAVFQWVPGHADVMARLMGALAPGGVLAVQLPDNFDEPSHYLMRETARDGPWAESFAGAEEERETILTAAGYYNRLRPLAARVDVWRTVYNHPLDDAAAIVAWLRSTGLRPYLNRLTPDRQAAFVAAYQARIAEAYPPLCDGRVLLAFPRLFVVAVRA